MFMRFGSVTVRFVPSAGESRDHPLLRNGVAESRAAGSVAPCGGGAGRGRGNFETQREGGAGSAHEERERLRGAEGDAETGDPGAPVHVLLRDGWHRRHLAAHELRGADGLETVCLYLLRPGDAGHCLWGERRKALSGENACGAL